MLPKRDHCVLAITVRGAQGGIVHARHARPLINPWTTVR
jgi:hypothetical protein